MKDQSLKKNLSDTHLIIMTSKTFALLLLAGTLILSSRTTLALSSSSSRTSDKKTIQGIQVHPVPLRRDDPSSPFCYAASSIVELKGSQNFLATQVWPSARAAAHVIEEYADPSWTICEFGCGPGMPSLAAASLGCSVIATDLEPLALNLVQEAAQSQGILSRVKTKQVDLIDGLMEDDWESWVPTVDLFVMSDVFESSPVAKGAADLTDQLLKRTKNSRVWVFAQSDRAQREVYLQEMKKKNQCTNDDDELKLAWRNIEEDCAGQTGQDRLWLCDLDETKVSYG